MLLYTCKQQARYSGACKRQNKKGDMSFHLLEGVNLMIKLACKQGEASTRAPGGNAVCGNKIFFMQFQVIV